MNIQARDSLIQAMSGCQQNATQTILQHGQSVCTHTKQLLRHLRSGEDIPEWWRIPQWAYSKGLLDRLVSDETIYEYTMFHDCGKPACRTVDEQGKQHFPDHARVSEQTWLHTGGDPLAARLIGMDMDAHLLKGDGIAEFASRPEATTLLIVALAEVHSNAAMFGGHDSDSFKIKAKHLEKRGMQVIAAMGMS